MTSKSDYIRAMRPEDCERVLEVYLLSHVDEYAGEETDFPPQGVMDNPDLVHLFKLSSIFVYDDSELKGFVGSFNDRISWLYVHPAHRGQQIGPQLIDFMLAELSGKSIGISVLKSNKIALDLYVNRGFRVIDDFIFNYQGVPIEVYSMRLGATADESTIVTIN